MMDKFNFGGWVGEPSGNPWLCKVGWEVADPCRKSKIDVVRQEDVEVDGLTITVPEPHD